MFCFDRELTLVSYLPKPSKMVLLLSTCHEGTSITYPSKKPEIIEYYNNTKGGVDTFDQMCSSMSAARKTNRWPMCMFYGLINIACINSYVIYSFNISKSGGRPLSRKDFMNVLFKELTQPHMTTRLETPTLQRSIRLDISQTMEVTGEIHSGTSVEGRRKTFSLCPDRIRRMTTNFCNHCKKPFCGEHRAKSCIPCDSKK